MKFTDTELFNELHVAVKDERNATLYVLTLLKEANFRQLYLSYGCDSLLQFCMKEFQYSETSANRRISAMRAMLDVPVIEEKIKTGGLSLDVIVKAQTHIRQKEKHSATRLDKEEKSNLFESLSGLSCRQAEKELIKQDPELFDIANKRDSLKQITSELQELKIILDEDMQKDLETLKMLLSHSMPGATIKELLKFAVKESIKKRDLQREVKARKTSTKKVEDQECKAQPGLKAEVENQSRSMNAEITTEKQNSSVRITNTTTNNSNRIYIPAADKRTVWREAQGQCCQVSNGRRCSSRFQLQIDHIVSLAKGGTNQVSNLQLLCRAHNQQKGFH